MTEIRPPEINVLHVDDDHVMRLMTKTALERSNLGFHVESCASGKEVLEKMVSYTPDILLIDMIMPIMNGTDLLREIRTSGSAAHLSIPAVFMTGKQDVMIENRSVLEPVIGIITKPFSPVRLGPDLMALLSVYHEK